MKALLINPETRSIEAIDIASHVDLAGLIGHDTIESDAIGTTGDRLYFDEECFLRGTGGRFQIDSIIPVSGRTVIVGTTGDDQLAEQLQLDPIELRRRNLLQAGTRTVNGQRVTSNGFADCLARVEEASGWRARRGRLGFGRGLGVAGSMYISGTNYPIYPNKLPQSGIQLKVDRSGLVTVFSGGNDIGQGTNSIVQELVAEELGLALDQVRVVAGDTDLCPVDLGAYSSRGTFMIGNAVLDACRNLRGRLVQAVAEHWQSEPARPDPARSARELGMGNQGRT